MDNILIVLYFHTIKSILNQLKYIREKSYISYFHTIKSILNPWLYTIFIVYSIISILLSLF